MKAILYIVAIVVACGASFVSYSFSEKFVKLQNVRLVTRDKNKTVTADVAVTEKKLTDEKAVLAEVKRALAGGGVKASR